MCRVVGKVVLEMRDLGQEPKHIVIAGVLRTALANKRIQRSELEKQAMETVINALVKSPFRMRRLHPDILASVAVQLIILNNNC